MFAHSLTLAVVLLGWIFFRAQTLPQAGEMLGTLLSWGDGTRLLSPHILAALCVVTAVHLAVSRNRNWPEEIANAPVALRIASYSVLLTILVSLGATDAAPFIYFQF